MRRRFQHSLRCCGESDRSYGGTRAYSGFEFHSLRQITRAYVFSGRTRSQLSPVTVPVSRLTYGLPIGRVGLLFSEGPVSLRSSGLHRFDTVLELPTFRVSYELRRKGVLRVLSNRRERPISNSPSRGSNPPAPASTPASRAKLVFPEPKRDLDPWCTRRNAKPKRRQGTVVRVDVINRNSGEARFLNPDHWTDYITACNVNEDHVY